MLLRHLLRVAVLSIALVCAFHSPAFAWDLFKHKGHHDCEETQTIRLPAQRVQVETTAPRVTIQESHRVSRGVAPVIGTIYMPVAMPLPGLGVGRDIDLASEDDFDALRTAHLAERATLRQEQARAALRAEVEAKQRVLERMGPTREACPTPTASDLDKRLKDISEQITKLTERVAAVEKLTLIHDNYLRDQIGKPKAELPASSQKPTAVGPGQDVVEKPKVELLPNPPKVGQ